MIFYDSYLWIIIFDVIGHFLMTSSIHKKNFDSIRSRGGALEPFNWFLIPSSLLPPRDQFQIFEPVSYKFLMWGTLWRKNFLILTSQFVTIWKAKFWNFKFQSGLTHAKLRRWDPIFGFFIGFRVCSFTWTGSMVSSETLLIFIFIVVAHQ